MRIQHNIMAMSAYRNYTNNVSAMKKNLEKLSSGYKINRAGDDAAGLAISEKMRAQITGLETAQKNAKDGISLVQTAEGALTEVHDMLNRMVELATQSANGTYDGTDRDQLQKEVDQLLAEINRIADSSNFNGIQLLDGSMDGDALGKVLASGADRIISTVYNAAQHGAGIDDVQDLAGQYTFLDGEGVEAKATKFYVDLNNLKAVGETTGTTTDGAATTTLNGKDATIALNTDNLTAALEGSADYAGATWTPGNAENITIAKDAGDAAGATYDITVNGVKLSATAVEDTTAGTITFSVGGNTVATLTMDDVANDAAEATLANLGNATIGNLGTYTAPAANPTVSLEIDGTAIATDVAVAAKDDATKLANKLATAIGSTVTINGAEWKVSQGTGENKDKLVFELNEDPTATNIKGNFGWEVTVDDGSATGLHTAGTTVVDQGAVEQVGTTANTVFEVKDEDLVDGATITIDGQTVTLAVGEASKVDTSKDNVVNLKDMEEGQITADQLNIALGRISEKYADGTKNFIVGVNDTTGTTGDVKKGLTIQKKDSSEQTYDTKEKLEAVFSINAPKDAKDARGLTLQLGDTAATYNQLTVNIKDCHAEALGIKGLKIDTQDNALASIDKIKSAINYVSDVRGTLGATQNRLDHTINNLSVMTENIQDAESTIRDTDVAEEMMAYTKNNILIQSAQAMLAQANQVPQGVLQLLQ